MATSKAFSVKGAISQLVAEGKLTKKEQTGPAYNGYFGPVDGGIKLVEDLVNNYGFIFNVKPILGAGLKRDGETPVTHAACNAAKGEPVGVVMMHDSGTLSVTGMIPVDPTKYGFRLVKGAGLSIAA